MKNLMVRKLELVALAVTLVGPGSAMASSLVSCRDLGNRLVYGSAYGGAYLTLDGKVLLDTRRPEFSPSTVTIRIEKKDAKFELGESNTLLSTESDDKRRVISAFIAKAKVTLTNSEMNPQYATRFEGIVLCETQAAAPQFVPHAKSGPQYAVPEDIFHK